MSESLFAARCVCGDSASAHKNPSHACDAGGYRPAPPRNPDAFWRVWRARWRLRRAARRYLDFYERDR